MHKRWIVLCLAGSLGLTIGIGGAVSASVYAKESKIFAFEGTVFDLKSSTSGLIAYGFISDKEKHPVKGVTVTIKSIVARGEVVTGSSGFWGFKGLNDGTTWTVEAKKSGLGSQKAGFTIKNDEDENFIINFKFRKVDE